MCCFWFGLTTVAYWWGQLLPTPIHLSYPGQTGPPVLWVRRLDQRALLQQTYRRVTPFKPSTVLVIHQKLLSWLSCANDSLVCLIITTLSLGCRGRSGAVWMCVCVMGFWGGELLSALLWESSHNPSLSENTISIHDSFLRAKSTAHRHTHGHTHRDEKQNERLRCSGQLR